MKIDWTKVPKGTPVRHASGHGVLFSRVGHLGRLYFKNIAGIETWYGEENVSLADPTDIAKYAVPDKVEDMAKRCASLAATSHDEKADSDVADRLIEESLLSLTTYQDIISAFNRGELQHRRLHEDSEWNDTPGSHRLDLDIYEYRVKPDEKKEPLSVKNPLLITAADISTAFFLGKTVMFRHKGDDNWQRMTKEHFIDLGKTEYLIEPEGKAGPRVAYRMGKIRNVADFVSQAAEMFAKADGDSMEREIFARVLESGKYDDEIKDRAVKMMITGAMKIEESGIAPDTIERLMPTAMAFFKKAILEGHFDVEVVGRFNGLVKEDRIRVVVKGNEADKHIVTEDNEYRLLPPEPPKPQYRKFTAVEAAGHLHRAVRFKNDAVDTIADEWHIAQTCIVLVFGNTVHAISYEKAVLEATFTDTNEPFGVKL